MNDTASRIVPTLELNLTEVGSISSSAFGNGNAGLLTVQANSLSLENNASIGASTQSGTGGEIELKIAEDLTLANNSSISARAFQEADGGNLDIDARFIIAFPNGNNDIIAIAEQGNGGNIDIKAETLFGIRQREQNPLTNDIDASSDFGIDGNISINLLDVDVVRGAGELPTNIVLPEQTTTQTCPSNREAVAQNSLTIKGKGGIPATPVSTLDSRNIVINGQINPKSSIPEPIETSKGKIQPARGVKVTKSGNIILTPYQTDSSRDRLTEIQPNCN
ncbi:MAG: hypothetical protein QNJ72_19720 [Pleurocapsa sp. MO_226.B13]|nr:hypothetical protein [Pleurocapsa sp. MO_226.B13]